MPPQVMPPTRHPLRLHVRHAVTLHHLAQRPQLGAHRLRGRHLLLVHHADHAHAHVEGAAHVVGGHVARLLQPLEHAGHRVRGHLDRHAQALGDDARDVLRHAAARDVHHALEAHLLVQLHHPGHVDGGGLQQALPDGLGRVPGRRVGQLGASHLEDLAHEREAVGVHATALERQHHVARLDGLAVNQLVLLHRADRKAGQVVLALLVEPRHLGRLAAQQLAVGLAAALDDALDHLLSLVHVQLASGKVVQEEQGLGA
mmetsp:Transcript_9722/g.24171  ORF Transcript_9722/g.24171 Transcript_9722/m.24171 type:complete len:258 (-) Transcript_9722:430-1203(-)